MLRSLESAQADNFALGAAQKARRQVSVPTDRSNHSHRPTNSPLGPSKDSNSPIDRSNHSHRPTNRTWGRPKVRRHVTNRSNHSHRRQNRPWGRPKVPLATDRPLKSPAQAEKSHLGPPKGSSPRDPINRCVHPQVCAHPRVTVSYVSFPKHEPQTFVIQDSILHLAKNQVTTISIP